MHGNHKGLKNKWIGTPFKQRWSQHPSNEADFGNLWTGLKTKSGSLALKFSKPQVRFIFQIDKWFSTNLWHYRSGNLIELLQNSFIYRTCTAISPPRTDCVLKFSIGLRCLFETSEKNSAVGVSFFCLTKIQQRHKLMQYLHSHIYFLLCFLSFCCVLCSRKYFHLTYTSQIKSGIMSGSWKSRVCSRRLSRLASSFFNSSNSRMSCID